MSLGRACASSVNAALQMPKIGHQLLAPQLPDRTAMHPLCWWPRRASEQRLPSRENIAVSAQHTTPQSPVRSIVANAGSTQYRTLGRFVGAVWRRANIGIVSSSAFLRSFGRLVQSRRKVRAVARRLSSLEREFLVISARCARTLARTHQNDTYFILENERIGREVWPRSIAGQNTFLARR